MEADTSARGSHKLWQPLHNLALYSGWISFFFSFWSHHTALRGGEEKKKTTEEPQNIERTPPQQDYEKNKQPVRNLRADPQVSVPTGAVGLFFFFFHGSIFSTSSSSSLEAGASSPLCTTFCTVLLRTRSSTTCTTGKEEREGKKKKKKREKSKCWWRVDQIWLRAETVWTFEVIRSALRCVCVCVFSNINPLKCCFPSVDPNELQPLLSNYVTTWKGEEAPHTVRRKSYRYIFNDLTAIIWTFLTFFWKDDHTARAKNPNLKSSDGYRINTVELRVKRFPSELQWSASGG